MIASIDSSHQPRRTVTITWSPRTTYHFKNLNSATHVHRRVREVRTTTVCTATLTTSLPDLNRQGGTSIQFAVGTSGVGADVSEQRSNRDFNCSNQLTVET
ncbi:hypothetical protein C2E31_07040 [Rhodopirellula baltica]|nr:hypothetical protein C2E31_07040 [Rhodopirellula baltica]